MGRLRWCAWFGMAIIPSIFHGPASATESPVGKTLEESHFISKGAVYNVIVASAPAKHSSDGPAGVDCVNHLAVTWRGAPLSIPPEDYRDICDLSHMTHDTDDQGYYVLTLHCKTDTLQCPVAFRIKGTHYFGRRQVQKAH